MNLIIGVIGVLLGGVALWSFKQHRKLRNVYASKVDFLLNLSNWYVDKWQKRKVTKKDTHRVINEIIVNREIFGVGE